MLKPTLRACALALLLAAVTAPLTPAALAQVRVGMATSLSGPFAGLGADVRDGFNLALKNNGGKLGGVTAEVQIVDEQGNPDTGRQAAEKFIKRDKVHFFTGPIGSNVALAVGPALFESKTIYISPNAGPSQYAGAQCNPWFFAAAWQNDTYHEAAGKFTSDRGFKRVVVLAPNYPAGKDALTGFKRYYKGTPADEIYTKFGQLDYAAELAQIRAAKPDALYIFLPGGMGINFIKQFVGSGLSKDVTLIAPGFSGDEDIIKAVGEPMLGLFNTAHWNHDFTNPASQAFVAGFEKEYGRLPTIYAAQGFDTALLMDAAVKSVKGKLDDHEALRLAVKNAHIASVRGEFKLGVNQFPVQSYYLRVIGRDARGRITNKTVQKIFDNHVDAYADQCKMKG